MSWNASSIPSPRPDDRCFHLPDPKFHEATLRYSSNLVTGVLNALFIPVAITANVLTICALLKNPCLQQSLNVLLGCLALSDALVGLAVQPSYVAFRLLENQHGFVPCGLRMFYSTVFFVFYGGSFMTLCIISYERYFAVKLQGRYSELLRVPYVLKQVSFVWFVNIALNFLQWAEINQFARGIHLALWLACQVASAILYCLIFRYVRRHNRLQKNRSSVNSPVARLKFHKEVKLSSRIAVIVVVYFVFNLPVLLVTLYHQIGQGPIASYDFYSWSETLALLNSSINPFVCYWGNGPMRRAVAQLLRCSVPERNIAPPHYAFVSRAVHHRFCSQDKLRARTGLHECGRTQWVSAV